MTKEYTRCGERVLEYMFKQKGHLSFMIWMDTPLHNREGLSKLRQFSQQIDLYLCDSSPYDLKCIYFWICKGLINILI